MVCTFLYTHPSLLLQVGLHFQTPGNGLHLVSSDGTPSWRSSFPWNRERHGSASSYLFSLLYIAVSRSTSLTLIPAIPCIPASRATISDVRYRDIMNMLVGPSALSFLVWTDSCHSQLRSHLVTTFKSFTHLPRDHFTQHLASPLARHDGICLPRQSMVLPFSCDICTLAFCPFASWVCVVCPSILSPHLI
jgi:hypothetical protein